MPRFAEKDQCTGCTACASSCPVSCIDMQMDENGFAYPFISDPHKCISCGTCEAVCPVLNYKKTEGDEPQAFAAYSKNDTLRKESSSGGIFSEIARMVLANGGLVFGARYDECFKVCHDLVDNEMALSALRGAKYAESWLGDTFSKLQKELKQGRRVLFTGTPCQVAGLRAFLNDDYDNLICIDFICHSIPSPMVWEKYVEYRAKNDANGQLPDLINLRDKSTGWRHYQYSNYFKYSNGMEHRDVSTQSVFMKLFIEDYISRQSCANCRFKGYNRISDFTLGDFWGIWDIMPEMDDNQGTSIVLLHSVKGKDIWNSVKDNLTYKEVRLDLVAQQNRSLVNPSGQKNERKEVLDSIRAEGINLEMLCALSGSILKRRARRNWLQRLCDMKRFRE